jgi:hypothetical protein
VVGLELGGDAAPLRSAPSWEPPIMMAAGNLHANHHYGRDAADVRAGGGFWVCRGSCTHKSLAEGTSFTTLR